MIELSPGSQLLVMGVFAILIRYVSGQRTALPTPAGAAVMAIGIFIVAPLQQIPPLGPLATESLSIALLVVWASMAASYLQGSFHGHSQPIIGRFAIGTWVAATAVLARVVLLGVPEWRPIAVALAILAVVIWLWFLKNTAAALPVIVKNSSRSLTPGIILLATVSTQSLALAGLDLIPSEPARRWIVTGLIGAGIVFYVIGIVLVLFSHTKIRGWTIAEDWDNTNCILHGAMSITGLALASHPAMPPAVTLIVWYYAFGVFIVIESIEILRLVLRVNKHGWRQGVFSYRVTQWSRNFTFGMFYAFTFQVSDVTTNIGPIWWMPAVRSFILIYGSYAVLLFLLVELFIYCRHRFDEDRVLAINPWSRNWFARRTPSRDQD